MARRDASELQQQVVEIRRDPADERREHTAASVDSDAVTRLAASAPPPVKGTGRPPVHVAIPADLYARFTDRLLEVGLSKRAVVEQLIAGYVEDDER